MNRPAGMAERRSASEARRVANVRAALAARQAEQAAAARRRLVITLAAFAVTVLAWVAVAVSNFQWYLALFPTLVLAATLYLGVRAAQAERAEWAGVPESLRTPRAVAPAGPSYSPAQLRAHLTSTGAATTAEGSGLRWDTDEQRADLAADVAAEATTEGGADGGAESVAAPGTWTPVPVPVPTYTLKASVPRRGVGEDTLPESVDHDDDESAAEPAAAAVTESAPSIDLNAVLARRRAV